MQSKVVSSVAGLQSALKTSTAGGVIYLAPGDYGRLSVSDFSPTGQVIITSLRPHEPAHFDNIIVQRSSLLSFTCLDVGQPEKAPAVTRGAVSIGVGESRDIEFANLTLHGNGNGDPTDDPMGIRIRSSQRVSVLNSTFEEMHRAVVANNSDHIHIQQNSIENMSEDGLNFADVQSLYVSRNLIGNYSRILNGQHPDGIQVQTAGTSRASKDLFISDNIIYQGKGQVLQGIFMGNEIALPYENVNITNNLIFTQQYHGISIGIANGVNISNNTVLSTLGDSAYSFIMLNNVNGGTLNSNVAEDFVLRDTVGVTSASNLDIREAPTEAGRFAGMLKLLPDQTELIVPDVGFQGSAAGAQRAGVTASTLARSLGDLFVPQERSSASLPVGSNGPEETVPDFARVPVIESDVHASAILPFTVLGDSWALP